MVSCPSLIYCNVDFTLSENCSSQLGSISLLDRVNYWYSDVVLQAPQSGEKLLEYGGFGLKTGEIAKTFLLGKSGTNSTTLTLRMFESDTYQVYFTFYNTTSGSPCNVSSLVDISNPKVSYHQPKCIGTNTTVSIDYTLSAGVQPLYSLNYITNPSVQYSFKSTNATFEFPVLYSGDYLLSISGFNLTIPLKFEVQNPLKPEIEIQPFVIGDTLQTLKFTNLNSFSSFELKNSSVVVQPIKPGFYQFISDEQYTITTNSYICGKQVYNLNIKSSPTVVTTIVTPVFCNFTFGVIFKVPGANTSDYGMMINGGDYMPGTIIYIPVQSKFPVEVLTLEYPFSFKYEYTAPDMNSLFSYTILEYPTCQSNGTARLNFNGNLSLILISSQDGPVPIDPSDNTFSLSYNSNYNINDQCSLKRLEFNTGNIKPNVIISSTDNSCFGTFTVLIQNYDQFTQIILRDEKLRKNYTTTNGVFLDVIPSDSFTLFYSECNLPIQSIIIGPSFSLKSPNMDDFSFEMEYVRPMKCNNKLKAQINLFYKNRFFAQVVKENILLGQSLSLDIGYGNCDIFNYKFNVPNTLNTTSYKTIKSSKCRDSQATIQLLSDDIENIYEVQINNDVQTKNQDFVYNLLPGYYKINILIENDQSYCNSILEINIPYEKDMKINYTLSKQDSTNCEKPTGSIKFENPEEFKWLSIKNPEPQNATNGIFTVPDGEYDIHFEHDICGYGVVKTKVETNGKPMLKTIQEVTCQSTASGFYSPIVIDSKGNVHRNLDVRSNFDYRRSDDWLIISGNGQFEFDIYNQSCHWKLIQDFKSNDAIQLKSAQPIDLISFSLGNASISYSPNVRVDKVYSDGYFSYPENIYGLLWSNTKSNIDVYYNYQCRASLDLLPTTQENVEDYYEILHTKCGTLDIYARFKPEFLKNFNILSETGSTPDENGLLRIYYNTKVLIQKKMDFVSRWYILAKSIGTFTLDYNPKVVLKNETCINTGDGSISIENFNDQDYIYSLVASSSNLVLSNTAPTWNGLKSDSYILSVVSKENPTCQYRETIVLGAKSLEVTTKILNQCKAKTNGTVSFISKVGGYTVKSDSFQIDGVSYQSNNGNTIISLSPGNYSFSTIILDSVCKDVVRSSFEIKSNILITNVTSPKCSTAKVDVTGYDPRSTLTIKLLMISGGGNTEIGQQTTGYSAEYSNLKNATYQFVVSDSSGCEIQSNSFEIIECSLPTLSPTPTINQSYKLLPKYYLILILIIFIYCNQFLI